MPAAAPKIRFRDAQIEMAHGAGGKASRRLVEGLFVPLLGAPSDEALGDAAYARSIAVARGAVIDGAVTVTSGEPVIQFEEKRSVP